MWLVGVAAYAVGVMQRTSLGVAGIQAAEHFGSTVGIVSTFVVVQLATYALMQVPAGLLLDRFGSRALLTAGSLVMGLAQVGLALADSIPLAIAARIVLGMGDSVIFSAILRLLPFWFPPHRVPVLSQLIGIFGQAGQIASAVVLLPLIQARGWQPAVLTAASASIVFAVACLLVVRDVPPGVDGARAAARLREIPGQLGEVARHPATQLGFFVHLTAGFSGIAFGMMWGIPFLIVGQGRSQSEAALLFSLMAVAGAAIGPVVGWLTARHPLRRSNLVLAAVWTNISCWLLVLLWPGPAPLWLLVALVLTIAAGGPGTGIGFDFARTALPATRLGAANGIVISGAFSAGTLAILIIGLFLDLASGGRPYTPELFRWAMALQLPVFAVGLIGIHLTRRSLRRRMRADGVVVPSWREVASRYRGRYRRP